MFDLVKCENSRLFMDNVKFGGNQMTYGNNGFSFVHCDAKIDNSDFNSNLGSINSVIFDISGKSDIQIENSKFNSNIGSGNGSSISAIESKVTLKSSSATSNVIKESIYSGGFAHFENSKITIKDFSCINNQVLNLNQHGGCLSIYNSDTSLNNVTVTDNTANMHGGALYIVSGSVEIEKSVFKNNTSENGGAIYIATSKSTIKDSEISDNAAKIGAGVYFAGKLEGTTINTKFAFNWARDNGGAIYAYNYCDLKFEKCEFNSNEASYGSCFYLYNYCLYNALESGYRRNSADYGLIGYVTGSQGQSVILKDCFILSNEATVDDAYVAEEVDNSLNLISINE